MNISEDRLKLELENILKVSQENFNKYDADRIVSPSHENIFMVGFLKGYEDLASEMLRVLYGDNDE